MSWTPIMSIQNLGLSKLDWRSAAHDAFTRLRYAPFLERGADGLWGDPSKTHDRRWSTATINKLLDLNLIRPLAYDEQGRPIRVRAKLLLKGAAVVLNP